MGLLRNGRSVFDGPLRFAGIYRFNTSESLPSRNVFVGGFDQTASYPVSGNLDPNAYLLPQKDGGMASYVTSQSSVAVQSASLTPARPMSATANLQLTLTNAQLDQIVSAVASGALSISAATAVLAGAANASGSGTMTITVNSSLCGAIFSVLASASGSITPSVTISAIGSMTAAGGGPTALSPEALANAVWDAATSAHQTAGSMGKAVTDAGGAGNPWSATTAGNSTAGTFGEKVQKLLTTSNFIALK